MRWEALMLRRYLPFGKPLMQVCARDTWAYDARYTDGKCPICGGTAAGLKVPPAPAWALTLAAVPWDLVLLFLVLSVLVTAGVRVALWGGLAPGFEHSPLGRLFG